MPTCTPPEQVAAGTAFLDALDAVLAQDPAWFMVAGTTAFEEIAESGIITAKLDDEGGIIVEALPIAVLVVNLLRIAAAVIGEAAGVPEETAAEMLRAGWHVFIDRPCDDHDD